MIFSAAAAPQSAARVVVSPVRLVSKHHGAITLTLHANPSQPPGQKRGRPRKPSKPSVVGPKRLPGRPIKEGKVEKVKRPVGRPRKEFNLASREFLIEFGNFVSLSTFILLWICNKTNDM